MKNSLRVGRSLGLVVVMVWLLRIASLMFLGAPTQAHAVLSQADECKDRGGWAECSKPKLSPYVYRLCDAIYATSADPVRDHCQYYGYDAQTVTEANMIPLIEGFESCISSAERGAVCSNGASLTQGWGATMVGGCFNGQSTQLTYGEETTAYKSFLATGTYGSTCQNSWSEEEDARRTRTLACPVGYAIRTAPDGVHAECWKRGVEKCPTCGDPVVITSGLLLETEIDYEGHGPQPLRFARTFYSSGYHQTLGASGDQPQPMNGFYWSSTYERRIEPVPNSSYAMAVAVRADSTVKYFDFSGNEIGYQDARPEHLEQLSGGGWRYHTADDDTELYGADGKLLSITNRQGLSQTMTYSDVSTPSSVAPYPGLLIQVTDAFGHSLSFTYGADGLLATMTDPAGGLYSYGYNTTPALASVTYPQVGTLPATRQYSYIGNPGYLLTGITDEEGQSIASWTYYSVQTGYVVATANVNGASWSMHYGTGYISVTDPYGVATQYNTSLQAGTVRNTSVANQCNECPADAKSKTFDSNGFVASKTDYNGNVTTYVHDATTGLELSRTEAYGTALARTITTQWDSTYHVPLQIDEPGRRTTYTYDSRGNELTQTVTDLATGDSRTTTKTYTAAGLLQSVDGPRTDVSDVTTYAYDSQGNLASITDALGHATQFTNYDGNGNLLRMVDPNGVVTTMTYDARGRLATRTVAGATTTFEYDRIGQLRKTTLPDGSFMQNSYDAGHHLTDLTDNLGNTIHYTLDALGNRTRTDVKDPSGVLRRTQTQVFNNLGRLSEVHGANGQVTAYGYDTQGNRTSETVQTPSGNFVTATAYDALNRVTTVTDAGTGVTTYGYNALSQMTSVKDPTNLITQYVYSALGDLKQLVSPDTGTTIYAYDSGGNRASQTDARGIQTTYSYDALNRPTGITYPTNSDNVQYFYDGQGTLGSGAAYGIGRLTGVQDASGTTSYTYTARGQVATQISPLAGLILKTSYAYDAADRLIAMTYPSGRIVNYARDTIGRVSGISTTDATSATTTLASAIQYLPFGPATNWTLGNGVAVTHSFDQDYHLTSYVDGSLLNHTLAYDARNLITGITDNLANARSQTLTYDALGRLATASGAYGSLAWSYNATGDRLSETRNSVVDTYSYASSSHRLTSISGGHTESFSFDAAGNTTGKNGLSLEYNDAGRLTRATQIPFLEQNLYDAQGHRALKISGTQISRYSYDVDGALISETVGTGTVQGEYVYFDGLPLAYVRAADGGSATSAAAIYYFHTDQLGTPQRLSDSSAAVVWDASYEPFGAVTIGTAAITNPLRFAGQYFDAETGFAQNWNRDYDQTLGRFAEADPTGLDSGLNLYVYVVNNPLIWSDPAGLFCTADFVKHYWTGGGATIDLGAVGLLGTFQHASSVVASVNKFKQNVARAAKARAASLCVNCKKGTKSASFSLKDRDVTNVRGEPCLFAVGHSTFFRNADCGVTAKCDTHQYSFTCALGFSIRDWFEDPLDVNVELPFSTIYRINAQWQETYAGGGSF